MLLLRLLMNPSEEGLVRIRGVRWWWDALVRDFDCFFVQRLDCPSSFVHGVRWRCAVSFLAWLSLNVRGAARIFEIQH